LVSLSALPYKEMGGGGGEYTCMKCSKSYQPDEVYLLHKLL